MTLFHELGHAIHDLVSKTTYSCFHGTEVAIDFGEAPSQMLENWCWTPSILKGISNHYSYLPPYRQLWEKKIDTAHRPAERIPDSMIESLMRGRYVNSAQINLRQLSIGRFDMTVHNPGSHDAIKAMDIPAAWNNLRAQATQLAGPEIDCEDYQWGSGYTNLGHLMREYDAGYYSYLLYVHLRWIEVFY